MQDPGFWCRLIDEVLIFGLMADVVEYRNIYHPTITFTTEE